MLSMSTSNFPPMLSRTGDDYGLLLAVIIAVFLLGIFLARKKIRSAWLDRKTKRCLKRLGLKQIHRLQCPDGLGDFYTIDRLILTRDGVSLLEYMRYPGKIFCAEHIDHWTQMLGRKSYRFKNPFYDLECKVRAVEACIPGVAVEGYLFFDHLSEFPKGHPGRVICPDEIPEQLERPKQKNISLELQAAWKKLQTMAAGA